MKRLRRIWRRWRWYRVIARGEMPDAETSLHVVADWIGDVADGFHRDGDHDTENDVIAIGRQWATVGELAWNDGDAEQVRAVTVGAIDAVIAIMVRELRPAVREQYLGDET